jgi:hypothetical protein
LWVNCFVYVRMFEFHGSDTHRCSCHICILNIPKMLFLVDVRFQSVRETSTQISDQGLNSEPCVWEYSVLSRDQQIRKLHGIQTKFNVKLVSSCKHWIAHGYEEYHLLGCDAV